MRVLISGGGTGGHVYPAMAVVQALPAAGGAAVRSSGDPLPAAHASSRDQPDSRPAAHDAAQPPVAKPLRDVPPPPAAAVLYVGSEGGVEAELAARAGWPFRAIKTGQLRGRAPWTAARNFGQMVAGARQARQIVNTFRPDVCFVTGGYVCAPVVWAARRARVPILIYLPDLEPGMAVQVLSRFATRVAVSFPEALAWFPGKGVVTGYPVRTEFVAAAGDRTAAQAHFGLDPAHKTLLVFGGSRGSRSINQAVVTALPELLPACQIIHVSGTLDWDTVEVESQRLPQPLRARYHAFAYLHDDMAQAMAAADLVVARAGASTLGEFPAMALPAILVPYPYAGQHQDVNADYLVAHGAALKLHDEALAEGLVPTVLDLLQDDDRLASLATGARRLARPGAARAIAEELSKLTRNATWK